MGLHSSSNCGMLIFGVVAWRFVFIWFAIRLRFELRDGRFVAEHGTNLDVDDLEGTRELIVDELGTVSFPPEVLMKMGGSGRYEIAHNEKGEVTLVTAENNKSMIKGKKVLSL